MENDWTYKPLSEVAELIMGQSPPSSTYNKVGDGLPFFQGVRDFNYLHPTPRVYCSAPSRIAYPGDILFSVRAPIGRVNIADVKCATGRGIAIIRPHDQSDARYLEFLLRHIEPSWDVVESSGSVFGNATKKELESLPLLWPSRQSERSAIARILGTLDDKIELNRRMNETLDEMARAIFKDWFVDFGPVRAKMEGRDAYLPDEMWSLFPDRLVDSELGEIPEGWEVKALDEIANFRNGLALQKFRPKQNEDRLPVVKIAQLRSGYTKDGPWASANITPECIIDDGDVIFAWSGTLMVKVWCGGPGALNQHLFKVTSAEYPKWLYLHYTNHHLLEFQRIAADKTTTMGHIKRHHLSDAKCAIPNRDLISAMDGVLMNLLSRSISASVESRTLAAMRDTLLPKLVSGEVRVGGDSV